MLLKVMFIVAQDSVHYGLKQDDFVLLKKTFISFGFGII